MSKINFSIVLPHDSRDNKRTPGFFITTTNMTYLKLEGTDIRGARFGNANVGSGWKSRFEYGVTASKRSTRLSLILNTSVVLPAVSWTLPILGEPPKKPGKEEPKDKGKDKKEEKEKNKGQRKSRSNSYSCPSSSPLSSISSHSSRSSTKPRRSSGYYREHENKTYRYRDRDRERYRERERERELDQDSDEYPDVRRIREPREWRRRLEERDLEEQNRQMHSRDRRRRRQNSDSGFIDVTNMTSPRV